MTGVLVRGDKTQTDTKGGPCGERGRSLLSASQGKRPQEETQPADILVSGYSSDL